MLLLSFLSMSGASTVGKMDKFKWQASESAPKNYPMKIISGNLYFPEKGSQYIPDKSLIHRGWGSAISSHVVGSELKALPDKLGITFFSYTENKFYKGKFDLPYDKILNYFKTGYYSPNLDKDTTYTRIVVGVAPGGSVSVWLVGNDKRIQVFFGRAKEVDVDWSIVNDNPRYTREEYVRLGVVESLSSEALEYLHKHGVPLERWKKFQVRYNWQLKVTNMELRDGVINEINYYNGEQDYIKMPLGISTPNTLRVIPKDIRFIWKESKDENAYYELFFDETEMFEVFEKLGGKNQAITFDIQLVDTDKGQQLGVLISNDDEGVYLKKVKLDIYGAD